MKLRMWVDLVVTDDVGPVQLGRLLDDAKEVGRVQPCVVFNNGCTAFQLEDGPVTWRQDGRERGLSVEDARVLINLADGR